MSDQNPDTDDGSPPDFRRENPLLRSMQRAVDKLENSRKYIERQTDENRSDIRDIRDRLARLETKLSDLPSKVWIGTVVLGGMTGLGTLVAVPAKVFGR